MIPRMGGPQTGRVQGQRAEAEQGLGRGGCCVDGDRLPVWKTGGSGHGGGVSRTAFNPLSCALNSG